MAVKTFTSGEVLTASDTNTYLANSGLVFVKNQVVGSALSSVTVSDTFNADFNVYKVVYYAGSCTSNAALRMQLGSATTGYYISGLFVQFGTTSVVGINVSNGSLWTNVGRASSNSNNMTVEIFDPYRARRTAITTHSSDNITSGYYISQSGFLDDATSYTSFTISPASGTISGGVIAVYGYRLG